ncbi:MAG: hypothetical protein HYZ73_03200 [Elusimicrobia bacterium]|nr:hypothetical protein [Elusimicrobiota bacterium]
MITMGGGEAGPGCCERCGEVGAVRKVSWQYLCAKCRQVYETEALRHQGVKKDAQKPT